MNEPTSTPVDALGQTLRAEFDEVAALRRPYEDEWVSALRQYKGIYELTAQDRQREKSVSSSRSRIFMRLTKIKCDSIKARLMDLLFPANGVQNFNISPTPNPTVRDEAIKAGLEHFVMAGGDPNTLDQDSFRRDIATETCNAMLTAMQDQLAETPNRDSYRKTCDMVIASACRYGTGVLKGPLVEAKTKKSFAPNPETGEWEMQDVEDGLWPFFEFVPVWSIFPDLVATNKKQLRFVWQEHLLTAKDLKDLARFPKFYAEIIDSYVRDTPRGDATLRQYESDIRQLSEEYSAPDLKGRFRVLERWGYLSGAELRQAGLEIDQEMDGEIFASNVWIVGNRVIKAVLNPLQGVDFPYFFYHCSKDESSFFADGVPKLMRDCQSGINAAIRAMVDNAAMSSGPQIGINVRALAPGEDPNPEPWKTWLFDNADDMNQAMKVWTMPNISADLDKVLNIFQTFADELTTPRYMYGDQNVGGAGNTASGLSMLMGAANIGLKELVKAFDDDITIPFIGALYAWNMQWNPDDAVKGDYAVVATGTSSLMAKEIRAQQHQLLVGATNNPRFAGMTKDMEWLRQMFKDADMPDTIVRSDDEYKAYQQEQMAMQAKAQTDAMVQSMTDAAVKAGLDPQQAVLHVMAQLAPQVAGQGGAQPQQGMTGEQPTF